MKHQIDLDIARETGKPEQAIKRMIFVRMTKFIVKATRLGQTFVITPDLSIAATTKEAGTEITIHVPLEMGEGIEKREEDFAAEVAKTAAVV